MKGWMDECLHPDIDTAAYLYSRRGLLCWVYTKNAFQADQRFIVSVKSTLCWRRSALSIGTVVCHRPTLNFLKRNVTILTIQTPYRTNPYQRYRSLESWTERTVGIVMSL